MTAVKDDFIPLTDACVLAVAGPAERYLAMVEGAFKVLVEMPGGGLVVSGDARARQKARGVIVAISDLYDRGIEITETDVRRLIEQPASPPSDSTTSPPVDQRNTVIMGRRGAIAAKTAGQAAYLKELAEKDLVFAMGPAGSGKTFLAVAHGVALLLSRRVDKLIITRPAVEAGERLGFLPGDLNEKIDPYLTPIWGALDDILGAQVLAKKRETKEIEVAPLAYMRGRTLNYAYVIIDEAQNTTRMQMKMFLTRLGEGSKMVVTGDPSQVDLPNKGESGLAHAVGLLGTVKGVGVAELTADDIVRHELVARIVRAYDNEHKNSFS
ncbi:phoH-like family protein [Asticcacaulis biprosthecium C19]|uniref:PhoH-like protein n=1 Tax=Asticcacaulis biprosthecium C19 TaxID=715226 RepID=F4QJP4_9CAUL|nr:PhoH family protein [Asticcacaulis biprosthecium]EGF91995.1 phoH-like family protein [Asticcacaulis biprosthecium C19]